MPSQQSILILSSHTKPRLSAPINHQIYSQRHGYDYLFDATPYPIFSSPYDQKIQAVLGAMRRGGCDWIFWIDDDAYFMDQTIPLDRFIPEDPEVDFIICRSPVNPAGEWSAINAGLYFVRNSASARQVMKDALATDLRVVEKWWDKDKHGIFIGGDQEQLLYQFLTRDLVGKKVIIHDYTAFNTRPYHFTSRYDEHFICHLASHRNKQIPLNDMRRRFGLDRYLMPEKSGQYDEAAFRYSVFAIEPPPLMTRAKRRLLQEIKKTLRRSRSAALRLIGHR